MTLGTVLLGLGLLSIGAVIGFFIAILMVIASGKYKR